LELPPAPPPVGAYVPYVEAGGLVYTSGQLPMRGGKLVATGKVGASLSIEQAVEAARTAVLNALAQVSAAAGGLDRVERIVRITVYVNSSATRGAMRGLRWASTSFRSTRRSSSR
jgi:enamine deaminase RidA (YjgF/YER057c/UK114 family)